jgi:prolyl-tRNA synthetase
VPLRVTIGERSLKEGMVEVQGRCDSEAEHIAIAAVSNYVLELVNAY